ncbi:hypothetical protein ACQ4M3_05255 [Leptolyngbya sp. AN03gr2]|uniref:hypothetical protein n=1 Tax=unclassified Leptolyngbya TaxID=2650499 RepID=UPI003D318A68
MIPISGNNSKADRIAVGKFCDRLYPPTFAHLGDFLIMDGISYTPGSVPTYYDGKLHDACLTYGSLFEQFTLIEKFDIIAAIGLWGGYCAENDPIPLARYIEYHLRDFQESDAKDMLTELSDAYSSPIEMMGLLKSIANQISDGIWLEDAA